MINSKKDWKIKVQEISQKEQQKKKFLIETKRDKKIKGLVQNAQHPNDRTTKIRKERKGRHQGTN